MSLWTSIRDAFESAAVVVGNYVAPGSALLTSHLTSEGSQAQLGSPLGQLAQLGSGITGGVQGNSIGGLFSGSTQAATPIVDGSAVAQSPYDLGFQDQIGQQGNSLLGTPDANGFIPQGGTTGNSLLGIPDENGFIPQGGTTGNPVGFQNQIGNTGNPVTGANLGEVIPGGAQGVVSDPGATIPDIGPGSSLGTPDRYGFLSQGGTTGTPVGTDFQRALYSLANPARNAITSWAGSTGVQPWGSPGNLMFMGSGLYGMYQSEQLRKMAALAQQQALQAGQNIQGQAKALQAEADPWGQVNPATGTSGRSVADTQLQTLMKDPSGVTKLPGYQAGMDAVMRSMAAQGYNGSGNMMAALQKYGGDFYNNAISQLSGLSGANVNPGTGAQIGLQALTGGAQIGQAGINSGMQGSISANDLASRSLASLGYGVIRTQPNQLPPWIQ